jgi:hypothetical protein
MGSPVTMWPQRCFSTFFRPSALIPFVRVVQRNPAWPAIPTSRHLTRPRSTGAHNNKALGLNQLKRLVCWVRTAPTYMLCSPTINFRCGTKPNRGDAVRFDVLPSCDVSFGEELEMWVLCFHYIRKFGRLLSSIAKHTAPFCRYSGGWSPLPRWIPWKPPPSPHPHHHHQFLPYLRTKKIEEEHEPRPQGLWSCIHPWVLTSRFCRMLIFLGHVSCKCITNIFNGTLHL